jgi:hypothetical protein
MSGLQERVQKIVEHAVEAPSGDNSQPWRFVWQEQTQTLHVYNLPENDNPIFNYLQRGSLIAHGALLENIELLAREEKLAARIELLPKGNEDTLVATLSFAEDPAISRDPLVNAIPQRCTNRKAYHTRALTDQEIRMLQSAAENTHDTTILFEQSDEAKKCLATAVSTAERIMLQYKTLHNYFFAMVRWSTQSEAVHKSGLFVKTMELLPPQLLIFRLYSFWPIAKIFNKLGLPTFIAKENAKAYQQASSFLAFISSDQGPEHYILLGRTLQRVWLTATTLGLSVQPVAGVLFLNQRVSGGGGGELTNPQKTLVSGAAKTIAKIFNAPPENIHMLIRIGECGEPSSRSKKMKPKIEIRN